MGRLKVTFAKIVCPCGQAQGGEPYDSAVSLYQWLIVHSLVCRYAHQLLTKKEA